MQITVLSVGKIKEKYLRQGIAEFEKRIKPYCKLKLIEVNDEQAPEHLSEEQLRQVKAKEGKRLLAHIKPEHYVIALAIEGVQWSSEQLARELEQLATYGRSQIVFVIGGSNGLADEVLKRANVQLSFSKMTFPHQLMKLILMEQLYRSFKIMKGEPYHK
ncbi:Ribosomal RNA large subunit methyltransferase H [Caldalkalibacillus thermarum TA2.A1]|uniref:Ribosomal RNA large subunit methyltransferase H n=1 Tax=Caldalkalibacillus thermarum (strain TA2.A1) TaxID=986075 RepID=F5L8D9_CALTT|nr:23S rRNA (pseudouridine(1915)-N(3))-methyltransferase RlmH [Caldalkalibacillus thermarum]EGL82372.1 Ribosomal RNA large subunit methyltransferase H [Caldalkalibacillus thermarum TA2.A1]QZT34249.1 23S rRNA (pseudouridine(1915)-N(3))-methyltransferase RlmH [Caldalkalibacillus thermarum TA2.A1]